MGGVISSSLPRQNACCTTPSSTTVIIYGGVMEGHGAPVSPPVNLAISWVYEDLDTDDIYFWSVEAQAWNLAATSGNLSGSGSPQAVVTARPGATYVDTSGHTFWIKETGTGNTGWVQYI